MTRILKFMFHPNTIFAVVVWLVLGTFVNVQDQRDYSLQQAGVDALVERGNLEIGKSTFWYLNTAGDTFLWKGQYLPAKQPGQFVLGAIPYRLLTWLGFNYLSSYELTASLVTLFSATLVTALSILALFLLLKRLWEYSTFTSVFTALTYGFGTIVFSYSGVSQHDVIANAYIIFALYFLEKQFSKDTLPRPWYALLSGVFAGLTIFTSMLPALIVLTFIVYALLRGGLQYWGAKLSFCIGMGIGLFPLAVYNAYHFGNPFIQANMAGGFSDTFLGFDWGIFTHHVNIYFGTGVINVYLFMPIIVVGFVGVFAGLRWWLPQMLWVLAATALHLFYILNIETVGHCMFGPRYLLPLIPLLMLGIPTLMAWRPKAPWLNWSLKVMIFVVVGYSVMVNLLGALSKSLYCDLSKISLTHHLDMLSLESVELLTIRYLTIGSLIVFLALAGIWHGHKRKQPSEI